MGRQQLLEKKGGKLGNAKSGQSAAFCGPLWASVCVLGAAEWVQVEGGIRIWDPILPPAACPVRCAALPPAHNPIRSEEALCDRQIKVEHSMPRVFGMKVHLGVRLESSVWIQLSPRANLSEIIDNLKVFSYFCFVFTPAVCFLSIYLLHR